MNRRNPNQKSRMVVRIVLIIFLMQLLIPILPILPSVKRAEASPGSVFFSNLLTKTNTEQIDLDTSTKKMSYRFTAQSSKTILNLTIYVPALSSPAPRYRMGIQTNSAGDPSGSFINNGVASFLPNATGWLTGALNATVSLTNQTIYHFVVEYQSGTINSTRKMRMLQLNPTPPIAKNYYFNGVNDTNINVDFYTGSWVIQNRIPIFNIRFTDGTFYGQTFRTETQDDIFGNTRQGEKFTKATAITISAITIQVLKVGSPTTDLFVQIYNNTASAVVLNETFATSAQVDTSFGYVNHSLSSNVVFKDGTQYTLFFLAGGDSSNKYQVRRVGTDNLGNDADLGLKNQTWDGTRGFFVTTTGGGVPGSAQNHWDMNFIFTVKQATAPASTSQLTINVKKFDASTNCITKCYVRIEGDNGTLTRVQTDGSGNVVTRVNNNQPIRLTVQKDNSTNVNGYVKVNGTNTQNVTISSDSTKVLTTSIYKSYVAYFSANDGTTAFLRLNWWQFVASNNGTTINKTLTSTSFTFAEVVIGNNSITVPKITAFSAMTAIKNNIKNSSAVSFNVTADSQASLMRTLVDRLTTNFYRNDGTTDSLWLTSIIFGYPNGTILNIGSGITKTFYMQNGSLTPDAFRCCTNTMNVKANSTAYTFAGSVITISFKIKSDVITLMICNSIAPHPCTYSLDSINIQLGNGTTVNFGSGNNVTCYCNNQTFTVVSLIYQGLDKKLNTTIFSSTGTSTETFELYLSLPLTSQITLNYFARDGATLIQSLSVKCRLDDRTNGTVSFVTGTSGSCVARITQNDIVYIAISLSGNNSALIKSSPNSTCCYNTWYAKISTDTIFTVRTSVEKNVVMRPSRADGTILRVTSIEIYFPHNGTRVTVPATTNTLTLPLYPTSNLSNTITRITVWSNNVKNSSTVNVNATADSASFLLRSLVALNNLREYAQNGNSAFSMTIVRVQAPNSTIITCGTGTGNSQSCYMQNGTWVPDAFRKFGSNVKSNSTGFSVAGSSAETFSFKLLIALFTDVFYFNDGNSALKLTSVFTAPNASSVATCSNSNNCAVYFTNGTITPVSLTWQGTDVKANATGIAFAGTPATYSFRVKVDKITTRYYMNAGNNAITISSSFTAPNSTSVTICSTNNCTVYAQAGTWTPSSITWQATDVKANATGIAVSGTTTQTFSFKLRIYTTTDTFYWKTNGTSVIPTTMTFTAPNGTSKTISSYTYFIQTGTNTLSTIIADGSDRHENATTWSVTSNAQPFSFALVITTPATQTQAQVICSNVNRNILTAFEVSPVIVIAIIAGAITVSFVLVSRGDQMDPLMIIMISVAITLAAVGIIVGVNVVGQFTMVTTC